LQGARLSRSALPEPTHQENRTLMPAEPSLLTIDTTALEETVRQMCAGHDRLETFLRGLFGDLDSLADEMTRHGRKVDSTRQDHDTRWSEREERLGRERQELESTFEQIQKLTDQLEHTADPEIQNRLSLLEQERLAWTQERAVLETELDTVRTRADELADTLDDERQRASGERKDWAGELHQMRQLLQSLSDRSVVPAQTVGTPTPAEEVPPERDDAQDPVLDSVMAQFEILQKDLARRRKAKPASK
jgi:SMC interacting uncharacterized protein involved in chromosome segregation